jgi:hypothetical protein
MVYRTFGPPASLQRGHELRWSQTAPQPLMYGRAVHGAQRPKLPKPLNLQRGYRTACRVHDELYRSNSNAGGGGELAGRPAAGMDAERPAVSWERKGGNIAAHSFSHPACCGPM